MSDLASRKSRDWKVDFAVLLLVYLVTFVTYQLAFPYLPIYMRHLGESEASAILWSGVLGTTVPLATLFGSAYWGSRSDRIGLKVTSLCSFAAVAAALIGVGFATSAWQVIVIFIFMGLGGAAQASLMAIGAVMLPANRFGLGMGLMQTAQFTGASLGPLVGGLAIGAVNFQGTFFIAAAVVVSTMILTWFFVPEPPRPEGTKVEKLTMMEGLRLVSRSRALRSPIVAMFVFQGAYICTMTLLPLHVQSLSGSTDTVGPAVGFILSCAAAGTAVGSLGIGWLGSGKRASIVALGSMVFAALATVPSFWITDTNLLAASRFLLGVCAGGVLPSLRAALAEAANHDPDARSNIGALYGFSQSALSGGVALGGGGSALVAASFGLPYVHLASALILFCGVIWWFTQGRVLESVRTLRAT